MHAALMGASCDRFDREMKSALCKRVQVKVRRQRAENSRWVLCALAELVGINGASEE